MEDDCVKSIIHLNFIINQSRTPKIHSEHEENEISDHVEYIKMLNLNHANIHYNNNNKIFSLDFFLFITTERK